VQKLKFPILTRTPIKEIIVAIIFDGPITLEMFEEFKNSPLVKKNLPFANPTFNTNVSIPSAGKKLETSSKNDGFFLKNGEVPDRALHIRFGSMTFHLLNKYEPLDNLIKELESYWHELTKIAKDITPKSITVRYLNLIIKTGKEPINHYVTIYPLHPFNTQEVNAFTNIRFDLEGALVTLSLTEGAIKGEKGIILDYTINKDIESGSDTLFNEFHKMREIKNTVFFNSITPQTVKIYQS
jgi:uncharacterized protein (TIGR04255 family)